LGLTLGSFVGTVAKATKLAELRSSAILKLEMVKGAVPVTVTHSPDLKAVCVSTTAAVGVELVAWLKLSCRLNTTEELSDDTADAWPPTPATSLPVACASQTVVNAAKDSKTTA
jgi:hypothetical protein